LENQETEHDERFMTLLEAALGLPSSQREEFLRNACRSDPELFRALRQQILWEERMGDFLLDPLLPRHDVERPFQAGELVAGRFRIIREVAEGGMGLVYEAIDERLEQRRAIKCAKPGFQRRLPPEARSAMRVTHDNICRIYEIHSAETDRGPIDFLSMEYVDGETLADRIKREGPLKPSQAQIVLQQLCSGLGAAHRSGLLHRDLKSNNVMLSESAGGGLRVVVMDFGLARETVPGLDTGLIVSSNLRGAAPYIAPELWEGKKASVASDIYALGVISYEMVTGQVPFSFEAPIEDRLTRLPRAPSTIVPHLPPVWDKITSRCLDPEPSRRFLSTKEVLDRIQPPHQTAPGVWISVVLALGLLMAAYFLRPKTAGPSDPVRLALLPAQSGGCDTTGINGVLYEISDRLRTPSQNNFILIPVSETTKNNVHDAGAAGSQLGATHALQTVVRCTGEETAITANILDTKDLMTVRDYSGKLRKEDLSGMRKALMGTVTAAFKLSERAIHETVVAAAYPYYAQGISFNRRDNRSSDLAIPLFRKAIELDANSALPDAGLAEAYLIKYRATGDSQWLGPAREALSRAESHNPDSAIVHFEAGGLARAAGWYDKALENYLRAIQLEPANGDFWDHLAITYQSIPGRQSEAAHAFQKAVELQSGYFEPHLDFGIFYFRRGDYAKAELMFRKVTELAPQLEAGYSDLCAVYTVTGSYVEAETNCRKALTLKPSARAYNNLGAILAYLGRDEEAVIQYRAAIGLDPSAYWYYQNIGDCSRRLGKPGESTAAYQLGRDMAEDALTRNPSDAYARSFVGYFDSRLGSHKSASNEIAQALQLAPEDVRVVRMAVLTYVGLRQGDKALGLLRTAPPTLLRELNRHPDLQQFRLNPQFQQLVIEAKSR
jgi:serine/threonine-protein kinase